MEGNPQPTDYAAILADMEAKYSALGNAITSLRALLATGALGVVVGDSLAVKDSVSMSLSPVIGSPSQGPIALPRGAFLGKTVTDAIKLYLSAARKKQTNKDITQALRDGGLESRGNFDNLVTNGLFRLKQDGTVLRFEDGWGLAEWYPESFRNRITQEQPKAKRKKKAKALRRKSTSKDAPPAANGPTSTKPKMGVQIENLLQTVPNGLMAEAIAKAVGANVRVVDMVLAKMAAKGIVEKNQTGGYRTKLREMLKAV